MYIIIIMYFLILIDDGGSRLCEASKYIPLIYNIGVGVLLIIMLLITIILTTIIIVLITRSRRKRQSKEQKMDVIYDEVKTIGNHPTKAIDIQKNSAYGCAPRMCT